MSFLFEYFIKSSKYLGGCWKSASSQIIFSNLERAIPSLIDDAKFLFLPFLTISLVKRFFFWYSFTRLAVLSVELSSTTII